MKRLIRYVLFLSLMFFGLGIVLANEEKNLVNIYLFYSDTCPHCASEEKVIEELEKKYDNIVVYRYEVGNSENARLLEEVAKIKDTTVTGVPFTVIGDKVYKGFSESDSKERFMATIEYYSEYGYNDLVGEYIGGIELPSYQVDEENQEDLSKYIDDYTNVKIDVPLIGSVDTKNLTLPVIAILIGLVDGFNPCAMWVLLFLISMLIGLKNKRRMLILGITFLTSSALIYLIFMLAWLNLASLLLSVNYVRLIIGFIALGGALINIVSYFKHHNDNGCSVVSEKKRGKIFAWIKKFTSDKNLVLAIFGIIVLSFSVNIVELACSAGLPVMFIEILSMNNLTIIEEVVYIALYMMCFLLDDLVIFVIAVRTMEVTGISSKYGKLSKLIGGILLLIIGILLIFKPEWLMFNF